MPCPRPIRILKSLWWMMDRAIAPIALKAGYQVHIFVPRMPSVPMPLPSSVYLSLVKATSIPSEVGVPFKQQTEPRTQS